MEAASGEVPLGGVDAELGRFQTAAGKVLLAEMADPVAWVGVGAAGGDGVVVWWWWW